MPVPPTPIFLHLYLVNVYNKSYFLQSNAVPPLSFAMASDAIGTVVSYLRDAINPTPIKTNYVKISVFYVAQGYDAVIKSYIIP